MAAVVENIELTLADEALGVAREVVLARLAPGFLWCAVTAGRARELLRGVYADAVMVRTVERVAQLASGFPSCPAGSDHYREMVALYDGPQPDARRLLPGAREGLVQVVRADDDATFGLVWKPNNTVGNLNALVEKQRGVPAATRTLGTLQRLVAGL